jgi:hypothetical protein
MPLYATTSADPISYHAYNSNEILVFPFHETCFKVLCRSFFGHENVTKIDKDILYSVLSQLNDEDYSRYLDVDYGEIEGMEQTWDCISGEEVRSYTNHSLIQVAD